MSKIKIFILTIVIVSVMTSVAFAAIQDPWGPQWYTPYDGSATVNATYVAASGLKWSQNSINSYASLVELYAPYWEFEFRPNTGHPDNYWNGENYLSSNLPNAFKEYEGGSDPDANDVTIGSLGVFVCNTSTTYFGTFYLYDKSGSAPSYTIESEYGQWLFGDGLPNNYEQKTTTLTEGNSVSW